MSPSRRRAVVLLLAACAATFVLACTRFRHAVGPDEGTFVASRTGSAYHLKTCPLARRIRHRHMLFYKSGDDAYKDGFTPCRVCHPDQAGR